MMLSTYIFFFQAEDGIRDYKVTGVQTCALPISRAAGEHARCLLLRGRCDNRLRSSRRQLNPLQQLQIELELWMKRLRSEERRVGKECKAGSSGAHGKKRHSVGRRDSVTRRQVRR